MDTTGRGSRGARTGLLCAGLVACLVAVAPDRARASGEPWEKNAQWVTGRVGVAKSGATLAAGASTAMGFGYTWMLGTNVGWSAWAGYDRLGKYGGAAEIEVPITTEFSKHFAMGPAVKPYLGLGWGFILHKTYRTGADESAFRQGIFVSTGANMSLGGRNLVGADFRFMIEQDTRSINPTFPNDHASDSVTSLKVGYSRVF